jgi:CRISPR-associated exonuclease Cas4
MTQGIQNPLSAMDSLPISALQHLLFCPRQCALIHLDQRWTENRFTAEGRVMHEHAHEGPDESRPGLRITRGLPVRSEKFKIHGVCDIVEFHQNGTVLPVEYKRGKPKAHRADEVQLCAQALCLEETLQITIPLGYLYYGLPHRRTAVPLDTTLRDLTIATATSLHQLLNQTSLPPAIYEKNKCPSCSLIETCQPKSPASAKNWLLNKLNATDSPSPASTA